MRDQVTLNVFKHDDDHVEIEAIFPEDYDPDNPRPFELGAITLLTVYENIITQMFEERESESEEG